jgi:threonine/homoserine/homoserine lactone efflux protein
MENPLLFALAVLTILGTPGPTNTLLATSGATVGIRRSLALIPAETAGYLISILTLGLVLGPIVAANPMVALVLRSAVGLYLLWLAVRLWRKGGLIVGTDRVVTPPPIFVTTLLNPKAIVFALGVVPFGAAAVWPYLAGFVAMLTAVALGWIALGAALGGGGGKAGPDRPRSPRRGRGGGELRAADHGGAAAPLNPS